MTLLVLLAVVAPSTAQGPGTGAGLAETLEAIERARVVTRILYVTAHPDDESSSILTYLARGLHADVALLSLTRGEGGQNALGPEQAPQLGIIRTAELEAATKQYGVRLFFTRAQDFGYSKTPEETLRIWGDAVRDDIVEVLRHFRPHIIINGWGGVTSGHGQHQAAGLLVPLALEEVTRREPEWPWKDTVVFNLWRGRFGETGGREGLIELPTDEISPIWGRSYNEIGLDGFVNHRTQGVVGFRGSRFFRGRRSLIPASGKAANSLSMGRTQNGNLSRALQAVEQMDWAGAARLFAEMGQPNRGNIQTDRALALTAGIRLEAEADRSELVAGEMVSVQVRWHKRPEVPLELSDPELVLPQGWTAGAMEKTEQGGVRFAVQIPPEAKVPSIENDWMHPWPAALVHVRMKGTIEGYSFTVQEDVTAQRVTTTRVDTLPLTLVPAVTLTPEPRQFVVPSNGGRKPLELVVRVRHYATAKEPISVGLDVPAGWQVTGATTLDFDGAGDQLVRFVVTPPAQLPAGNFALQPWARRTTGGEKFITSVEPLPTLPTRLWSEPAVANVRVFDINVPRGLRVGYVAAENDPIPGALRQLGIEVTMLDELALAFGDLSRFDAIAIGIRAYELRQDLIRANRRLLDYCAAGGTLVVQYQRDSTWNRLNPGPFPAKVGDPTLRVSVEEASVRLLEPAHVLLNVPNRISARDFDGWVQERGLYFWGEFDQRYTPLLGMHDPDEAETTGSLVVARHGRGTYIYTGLSFFRQLPAGVPGAYRLFVNLLSQSKAK